MTRRAVPNNEEGALEARSVSPLDADIDDLEQRLLLRAVGEDAEGIAGDGAVVAGPGDGVAQRAVLGHQADRAVEVAVAMLERFQRAAPEAALLSVAAAEGEDDRQGDLALLEIVADRLAELGLLGRVVEHVVDQLEGDAEIEP